MSSELYSGSEPQDMGPYVACTKHNVCRQKCKASCNTKEMLSDKDCKLIHQIGYVEFKAYKSKEQKP